MAKPVRESQQTGQGCRENVVKTETVKKIKMENFKIMSLSALYLN